MTRICLVLLATSLALVALVGWLVIWLSTNSGLDNPGLDHPPKVPDYSGSAHPAGS